MVSIIVYTRKLAQLSQLSKPLRLTIKIYKWNVNTWDISHRPGIEQTSNGMNYNV